MGREVRMVPKGWQHPKDKDGRYLPLLDGADGKYKAADAEWQEDYEKWQQGLRKSWNKGEEKWLPLEDDERGMTYTQWNGPRPSPDDYMPDWPKEQRTHFMMYEDTSEGTPISPAFATPEEAARSLSQRPEGEGEQSSIESYETDEWACAAGVLRFSAAMRDKLDRKRKASRGGWNRPDECSLEDLRQMLDEHSRKGDVVDIGNLCMMIWNREHPNG